MKPQHWAFVVSLLLLVGCNPAAKLGERRAVTTTFLLKKMNTDAIDCRWFAARVKVDYQTAKESVAATMQIKIEKDKAIWISAQKFGLEGVRVLVRTDSVFVLNRLERTYLANDFSYIQKEFGLPANFEAVQDLLLGNALRIGQGADYTLQQDTAHVTLVGTTKDLQMQYFFDAVLLVLDGFQLDDRKQERRIVAEQSAYTLFAKHGNFSQNRNFSLFDGKEEVGKVALAFSKIVFDEPQNMDFQVPSSYKKL